MLKRQITYLWLLLFFCLQYFVCAANSHLENDKRYIALKRKFSTDNYGGIRLKRFATTESYGVESILLRETSLFFRISGSRSKFIGVDLQTVKITEVESCDRLIFENKFALHFLNTAAHSSFLLDLESLFSLIYERKNRKFSEKKTWWYFFSMWQGNYDYSIKYNEEFQVEKFSLDKNKFFSLWEKYNKNYSIYNGANTADEIFIKSELIDQTILCAYRDLALEIIFELRKNPYLLFQIPLKEWVDFLRQTNLMSDLLGKRVAPKLQSFVIGNKLLIFNYVQSASRVYFDDLVRLFHDLSKVEKESTKLLKKENDILYLVLYLKELGAGSRQSVKHLSLPGSATRFKNLQQLERSLKFSALRVILILLLWERSADLSYISFKQSVTSYKDDFASVSERYGQVGEVIRKILTEQKRFSELEEKGKIVLTSTVWEQLYSRINATAPNIKNYEEILLFLEKSVPSTSKSILDMAVNF